jgi:D-alanine transaminase
MTNVYLNGVFIPQQDAVISAMDRGFLFGDGVYEVLPVYNGKIFRFEQHIDRLNRSLSAIKLSIDYDYAVWLKIFEQLLEANKQFGKNQSIYLQVTRGPAPERNHAFPSTIHPTIFAISYPLKTLPYEQLLQGKKAITLEDTRWQLCNIKATSLLANVLLYEEALDKECAEAILIRDGEVLEGATSNVFIVKNNTIITPPLSQFILGGVTRDLVLTLAQEHNVATLQTAISKEELFQADEVWITSSTREIYPIIQIDDTIIQAGKPGKIWHKMINHYHEFIENF